MTLPGMKKDTQTTNIILLPGETAYFFLKIVMYTDAHIHCIYTVYAWIYLFSLHTCISREAGSISQHQDKNHIVYHLNLFIAFLGEPHSLHVKPEDNPVIIDNGSCARFYLEIQDESGNITTNSRAPLIVHSKVCVYNLTCFSLSLTSRHTFDFSFFLNKYFL